MVQHARNLTDPDHGFLRGRRLLIMDRDPAFSERFRTTLEAVGVEPLKEECLNHCIPMGQAGLRHPVGQYLEHNH